MERQQHAHHGVFATRRNLFTRTRQRVPESTAACFITVIANGSLNARTLAAYAVLLETTGFDSITGGNLRQTHQRLPEDTAFPARTVTGNAPASAI